MATRSEITKVVLPVVEAPEELELTSKDPVVMESAVPTEFPLGSKVTEMEVVKIWKLTTPGELGPVTVEMVAL